MKKKINVLVTGSSKGIGSSIAKVLSQSGFSVFLTGRNEEDLKKVLVDSGAKDYFVVDLTTESGYLKLTEAILEKHGKIDALVNNAGEYVWSPVEKTLDKDIQRLLKLNVESPFNLIKALTPQMKEQKWGRIINIGSISGAVGEANASLYSMTKSALSGLTKALALELAGDGITVNTINPGWVDTELSQKACDQGDFTQEENIEMIPQRRFIEPQEVANLVKYLLSEEAKGLTGQCINLCAGLSIG